MRKGWRWSRRSFCSSLSQPRLVRRAQERRCLPAKAQTSPSPASQAPPCTSSEPILADSPCQSAPPPPLLQLDPGRHAVFSQPPSDSSLLNVEERQVVISRWTLKLLETHALAPPSISNSFTHALMQETHQLPAPFSHPGWSPSSQCESQ